MKKYIQIAFIALGMFLVSCENVEEKVQSFRTDFEEAINQDSISNAEKIVATSKVYYDGLSESQKQEFDKIAPSFSAILTAKKLNMTFIKLCGSPLLLLEEKDIQKGIDLHNKSQAYRKTLRGKDLKAFDDEVIDFKGKIIESKAFKKGYEWGLAIDSEKTDSAKIIATEINNTLRTLSPKYQKVFKQQVKSAKLLVVKQLQIFLKNGIISEKEYEVRKNRILNN